jgi:phosphoribosylaminoimidazolecarboxamide formyltransferase/IMP cyclohydrolase
MGIAYEKVDDLRYGTNPHQTACFYRPVAGNAVIGGMRVLKTGKSGLSQTNLEDISYSLNFCKFFDKPACACMKHVNPSGAAVAVPGDSLIDIYRKARDCDPRAAFGSVVAFNVPVTAEVAAEIMSTFVECVVAPEITAGALDVFNDQETYRLNRHIRVLQCGDLAGLPKYVGDQVDGYRTIKVLADGSLVVADPLLSHVHGVEDFSPASGSDKTLGEVRATVEATPQQLDDLLTAWYINLNVRSNGVVIVKNGGALAVGTGEQDRVGAVEQAVWKFEQKYEGQETIDGAVMASDGFFPFPDAIEVVAKAGVTAVVSPAGSLGDAKVVSRANELGVALYHAPERIFSHH